MDYVRSGQGVNCAAAAFSIAPLVGRQVDSLGQSYSAEFHVLNSEAGC